VERDFADRADAAATAARALINQDQVVAIVGPQFSRHAIPVSVLAEDARVPMISPMSSSPATTAGKRFVFRLAFLDDVQGLALARFALGDLGVRRAAVLFDVSTTYSRELADRFRNAFDAGGGRVVAFESYTADRSQVFAEQLRRIRAAAPDALFLPNFPDAVNRQIVQLQQLGLKVPLLGSDSWDRPSLPPLSGLSAYVAGQWRPDIPTEAARRFVATYRQLYGVAPRAAAALTYDAVNILLDAIQRAGSLDPAAIRDAIAATRDWDGAGGPISFAGRADPNRAVAISLVRADTFATMRLIAP
jgi:branched-chain amino acid transport system substrate-binding protein